MPVQTIWRIIPFLNYCFKSVGEIIDISVAIESAQMGVYCIFPLVELPYFSTFLRAENVWRLLWPSMGALLLLINNIYK